MERESVKREVLSVIERRGMGKIEGERRGIKRVDGELVNE